MIPKLINRRLLPLYLLLPGIMRNQKTYILLFFGSQSRLNIGRYRFKTDLFASFILQKQTAAYHRNSGIKLINHSAGQPRNLILCIDLHHSAHLIYLIRMAYIIHSVARQRSAVPQTEVFQTALAGSLDFKHGV